MRRQLPLDQVLTPAREVDEHPVDVRSHLGLLTGQSNRLGVDRVERFGDLADLVPPRDADRLHRGVDGSFSVGDLRDALRQRSAGDLERGLAQPDQRPEDRPCCKQRQHERRDEDQQDDAGGQVRGLLGGVSEVGDIRGQVVSRPDDDLLHAPDEVTVDLHPARHGEVELFDPTVLDHLIHDVKRCRGACGPAVGELLEPLPCCP